MENKIEEEIKHFAQVFDERLSDLQQDVEMEYPLKKDDPMAHLTWRGKIYMVAHIREWLDNFTQAYFEPINKEKT